MKEMETWQSGWVTSCKCRSSKHWQLVTLIMEAIEAVAERMVASWKCRSSKHWQLVTVKAIKRITVADNRWVASCKCWSYKHWQLVTLSTKVTNAAAERMGGQL